MKWFWLMLCLSACASAPVVGVPMTVTPGATTIVLPTSTAVQPPPSTPVQPPPGTPVAATATTAAPIPTSTQPMPTQAPSATSAPNELMLFDFNTATDQRVWFNQDDPVMGGVSRSTLGYETPGVLAFMGNVSLANNGGFAAMRGRAEGVQRDLSRYNAIRLRVRGDGKTYGFTMSRAGEGNVQWQSRFKTQVGEWQEITLPYATFAPSSFGRDLKLPPFDGRNVAGYGMIISDKQVGTFALEMDWVKALR